MTRREHTPSLRRRAIALVLAAPLAAAAQQGAPGLDLSEPARPAEEARPAGPPGGVLGPALGEPGERDAALADRVKAVQRKGFLKRDRLELTLFAPATLNDAFYQKVGAGARLGWNLQDSFALAVRGATWWTVRTDHVRQGQAAFQGQLLSSQPSAQLMLDGLWAPVYGKASWLGRRIVHFDLYLLAGLGAVWSDTSLAPRSEGPHPAADLGGGIRFYPADWLALELGLVATLYPDRPTETAPSTTTRLLAAHLGVTVFWPFSFEYRVP